MSRKSVASSDSSDSTRVSVQGTLVNLADSHNRCGSVKPQKKKRAPERFGECNLTNGWIRCTSRFTQGRDYFYNTVTGAKSWLYPVSQKVSLSDYDHFMVPGLTLTTSSQEDESHLALSSSEQPVSQNFIDILRVLNRLYPTPGNTDENQYHYNEDRLNNALCSSIVDTCLGTCETSFNDENVQSLINTICTAANVNGNRESKPEHVENDSKDRDEVSACDKEADREKNKEWKENEKNEETYLKTSIPLEQTDESSSSSSFSTSTTSSSNTSSSNTSSTTRTNTSISYSISATDVSALPASPVRPAPPHPPVTSGSSKEFGVPRLKTITFDDLQKTAVKQKLAPKRIYKRKTSQPPKPKPPREPRGPEAIIREVGNVRTISYNHFVPPPSRSANAVKRSNLSDSSYSTLSDAKRFAETQTKGVFGKGFGENFPIVIKSPRLSESSSSASESGRD